MRAKRAFQILTQRPLFFLFKNKKTDTSTFNTNVLPQYLTAKRGTTICDFSWTISNPYFEKNVFNLVVGIKDWKTANFLVRLRQDNNGHAGCLVRLCTGEDDVEKKKLLSCKGSHCPVRQVCLWEPFYLVLFWESGGRQEYSVEAFLCLERVLCFLPFYSA